MKTSEITLAVFTDYPKALDTIDFSVLIKKMHTLNFFKDFIYWIFSYLQTDDILYKLIQTFLTFYIQILVYYKDLFFDQFFLTYA